MGLVTLKMYTKLNNIDKYTPTLKQKFLVH